MILVVRGNYGDDTIALIAWVRGQMRIGALNPDAVFVVYVDTGWAAANWQARVEAGENFARRAGFTPVTLYAKATFPKLVEERKAFPSRKFQWCAGFLKGLPFMEWLDEHDPACQWRIALPKRQALYRNPLPEIIPACEYHGEREVWHPILDMSNVTRDNLVMDSGFSLLNHRSLECQPCVNSTAKEFSHLSEPDRAKITMLEKSIGKTMKPIALSTATAMDAFSMGCGDPFGCGL